MFKRAALLTFFALLFAAPPVWGFHDLDCGPFRATVIDEKTGERKCVALSDDARRQFQRFRELQQEQEKRIRDLELQHQQRVKAQELLLKREKNKQQQFSRENSLRRQRPVISLERSGKALEQNERQRADAAKRREQQQANDLFRQKNLLEQSIELPRADLLDDQKTLIRRVLKDQEETLRDQQ